MKRISTILLSATFWWCFGSFIGWYIGNQGGFRRGVRITSDLVIELMQERDASVWPRSGDTDI